MHMCVYLYVCMYIYIYINIASTNIHIYIYIYHSAQVQPLAEAGGVVVPGLRTNEMGSALVGPLQK